MRKTGLALIALLLCVFQNQTEVQAQNLKFGLALSPTISWLSQGDSDVETAGSRLGAGFGIIVDYQFSDNEHYFLSTGLELSPSGGKFKLLTDSLSGSYKAKVKLQNLAIPLNLKFRTDEIGFLTYFAQLGFTPSLAIRTRYDVDDLNVDNEKAKSITNPFNLSLNIGGGAEYSLGENTVLFAGLFFNKGFIDVVDYGDGLGGSSLVLKLGIFF